MSQVVFDFAALCTANRVDERAVAGALKAILAVGHSPCSREALSVYARYSPRHMHRILTVLRFEDADRGVPPVIYARGGKRGRGLAHRYDVNFSRARELGLLNDAA